MTVDAALKTFLTVSTRRELWKLMVEHLHLRGVTMVAYHATDLEGRFSRLIHSGFPTDWVDEYVQQNFLEIDPLPEIAASMERPFYWHELPDLMEMTPDRERFMAAMHKTSVGDGIAFYLYGPRFQNAFIGLGFGQNDILLTDEQIFELQCLTQAAHLRYCVLSKERRRQQELTARERDVLELIALGKSNSVIADILSMSPHTVDSHVRKIFAKLDVADRTTAALRGLGRGLIQYRDLHFT